jgi:hypothetical protein
LKDSVENGFDEKNFGARERWSGFPFNFQQPNQMKKTDITQYALEIQTRKKPSLE